MEEADGLTFGTSKGKIDLEFWLLLATDIATELIPAATNGTRGTDKSRAEANRRRQANAIFFGGSNLLENGLLSNNLELQAGRAIRTTAFLEQREVGLTVTSLARPGRKRQRLRGIFGGFGVENERPAARRTGGGYVLSRSRPGGRAKDQRFAGGHETSPSQDCNGGGERFVVFPRARVCVCPGDLGWCVVGVGGVNRKSVLGEFKHAG